MKISFEKMNLSDSFVGSGERSLEHELVKAIYVYPTREFWKEKLENPFISQPLEVYKSESIVADSFLIEDSWYEKHIQFSQKLFPGLCDVILKYSPGDISFMLMHGDFPVLSMSSLHGFQALDREITHNKARGIHGIFFDTQLIQIFKKKLTIGVSMEFAGFGYEYIKDINECRLYVVFQQKLIDEENCVPTPEEFNLQGGYVKKLLMRTMKHPKGENYYMWYTHELGS